MSDLTTRSNASGNGVSVKETLKIFMQIKISKGK
jgi:hypothetical protein